MAKTQTDLNDLWNDLKGNPALLVVVLIVIGLILYYVYKKNNTSTTATTTNTTPTQSPYYLINDIITPPGATGPAGPTGATGPAGPPGAAPPPPLPITTIVNQLVGKTRPKTSSDDNNAGVGVYDKPGGTITRRYAYNSDVTVIGTTSTVSGVDYYPIQGGGYIRERDLIGFG